LLKLSVTKLADQYLAFVREGAQNAAFSLAADYLVMAAWLAYLKSRLLLPKARAAGRGGAAAGRGGRAPGLPPGQARRHAQGPARRCTLGRC